MLLYFNMEIFISIDGVLRNTIQKFDYHYKDYYFNSDTEEDESFEYGLNEPVLNDNLFNHYKFQSEEEYKNFLFVEFPIEIFGHAGISYPRVITELNELIYNNKDDNFTIVGLDEFSKSRPSTLFFLSKNGFLGYNIKFTTSEKINDLWNTCDLWVTDSKKIIDTCPNEKNVIKFNTDYNKHFTNTNEINKLTEIKEEWLKYSEKTTI